MDGLFTGLLMHSDVPITTEPYGLPTPHFAQDLRSLRAREVAHRLEELFPGRPEMQALFFRTKIAPHLSGPNPDMADQLHDFGMFNHLRDQGKGPYYTF